MLPASFFWHPITISNGETTNNRSPKSRKGFILIYVVMKIEKGFREELVGFPKITLRYILLDHHV
jgi:hypothetical protein